MEPGAGSEPAPTFRRQRDRRSITLQLHQDTVLAAELRRVRQFGFAEPKRPIRPRRAHTLLPGSRRAVSRVVGGECNYPHRILNLAVGFSDGPIAGD